jgi:hypothetical protein
MNKKIAMLAEQLLGAVPKSDMRELVEVLAYYNDNFAEGDRVKALNNGSREPSNPTLELTVRKSLEKTAGSQEAYLNSNQPVCRCCGR